MALATLARDLHADTGQLQWITTAYMLTGAVLMLATLGTGRGDLTVVAGMALVGAGVGLAQPPAMNATIGAFPAERAGSASALINAIRQLAGVFGVAVIGAAVASLYTARLAGRLAALPGPQRAQVRASVVNVGPHAAGGLRTAAFTAFTQSMGIVLACCAAVALLAIAAVAAIPGKRY